MTNPAFDEALRQHLSRLKLGTTDEVPWTADCTPENVLEEAQLLDAQHEKSSLIRRCSEQIKGAVDPLQSFFSAVDSAVSSNPEIAGIVWGCMRFLLKVDCHDCYAQISLIDATCRLCAAMQSTLKRSPRY